MTHSWWNLKFSSPFIVISKCEDTQERLRRGRRCKNDDRIRDLLKKTYFYLFNQVTEVNPDLFSEEDNFFPMIS